MAWDWTHHLSTLVNTLNLVVRVDQNLSHFRWVQLVKMNCENLGMMSHSIEMFWHVLRNTNGLWWWKCWGMSLSPFIKTDGWVRMRYHSNFTIQPQYLNWVRLSRKFICISISSLTGEVWAEATSQCCPPMQCPGWQMAMAGRPSS